MYEESQQANTRLKDDLEKVRNELISSKKKFEEALKVNFSILILRQGLRAGDIFFLPEILTNNFALS